jgi:hypothetical protein
VRIALAVLIGITWGTQMARGNVPESPSASAGARARVTAVGDALQKSRASAAPPADDAASHEPSAPLLPSSSTAIPDGATGAVGAR